MPSTSLVTTSPSIFDRFKGQAKLAKWLAISGFGAGFYFLLPALQVLARRLVDLAENTLYLTMELGALGLLIFIVTNPEVHAIAGAYWQMLIRGLMIVLVNMNPIAIADAYVRMLQKRMAELAEQITRLFGHIRNLRNIIEENDRVIGIATQRCTVIAEHNKNPDTDSAFIINSRQASGTKQFNIRMKALLATVENVYGILVELQDWASTNMKATEDDVKRAKLETKIGSAARGALKSALSVIFDASEGRRLYDEARRIMGENFDENMGAIEEFGRMSEGFLKSIDLDKGIAADDMLKQLQTMKSRLLGTSSPNVIDVTAFRSNGQESDIVPANRKSLLLDDDAAPSAKRLIGK